MDILSGAKGMGRPEDASAVAASAPAGARDAEYRWLVGLLVFALVVRVATLGAYPLMDNTEARYGEIARKIVETGDWVMPQFRYGVPFWSKPPLSMWLTAIAYLGLGVSAFAARLASLLPCLAVAGMTYDLAQRRGGRNFALFATLVLVTTPLFFISAGAVMTDPALVLGTTLSMAGFWHAVHGEGRVARAWGYAFFIGLAIGLMAKGPVGVVLTFLPVGAWTLWKGQVRDVWQRLPWISGLLLTIALSLPWYLLAEHRTPGFLDYFIVGEHWKRFTVSGWKGDRFGTAHSRPRGTIWLYAVASTLPWCAVWMVWLARARRVSPGGSAVGVDDGWRAYLWLWMLAPAAFFTFAGNILFTYVLPGVPAFALLVAETWRRTRDRRSRLVLATSGGAMPLGLLLGVLFVLPPIARTHSQDALVSAYLAQRQNAGQRLIYLNEAPQSAEFYDRGKVTTAADEADLERYLRDAPRDYFALTDAQQKALPAIRARLTPVGMFGRYGLFVESRPQ